MTSTSQYDTYVSPLASRNASREMLRVWSQRHKFNTWRRIWLAVAEAQHELGQRATDGTAPDGAAPDGAAPDGAAPDGAPRASGGVAGAGELLDPSAGEGGSKGVRGSKELVTKEQVEELRAVVERGITDDEIRLAEKYEGELRHDVMAHVHALGDACPKARGIIHLGLTSQDVVCNADLSIIREAAYLLATKVARVCSALASQAERHKSTPTLGFTHYQPAQPLTVGRRLAGWASDLQIGQQRLSWHSTWMEFRGLRGATGTQASFMALLNNDGELIDDLEWNAIYDLLPQDRWVLPMVWPGDGPLKDRMDRGPSFFSLTGQTYPRVADCFFLADLAATASVLHKIATDIRLLSNRKELDEPFEDRQIGSSAMPYKRNPMRCERICGLCRFVMNLVGNAYDTAATQWLERTLDDSSNRRLSLPEAFLALDGALDLMHNVAGGLIVHEAMVRKNLMAELPFMATENIMMACVRLGGDRQHYHELIRVHAQAAGLRVKHDGLDNDLLERLRADKHFWSKARGGPLSAELDWEGLLDPMKYIGRSVEQTERYIKEEVEPLREKYAEAIAKLDESGPRV